MVRDLDVQVGRDSGDDAMAGIITGLVIALVIIMTIIMIICTVGALIGGFYSLKNYVTSFWNNVIVSNRKVKQLT